jgi:tRNA modification GTPase
MSEARDIKASALEDTIAAISTPLGEGGLGIVRISGKDSIKIANKIFKGEKPVVEILSHRATYGEIVDSETGEVIDEVLLTVFVAPKSYTAEDLVEISCHGGQLVLTRVLEQALKCGARLAEPGEFTLRAFINGRIDLSQAEAVAEVIRAKTDLGLKLALKHLKGDLSDKINSYRDKLMDILARLEVEIDFSEEDIEPLDRNNVSDEIESDQCGQIQPAECSSQGGPGHRHSHSRNHQRRDLRVCQLQRSSGQVGGYGGLPDFRRYHRTGRHQENED